MIDPYYDHCFIDSMAREKEEGAKQLINRRRTRTQKQIRYSLSYQVVDITGRGH